MDPLKSSADQWSYHLRCASTYIFYEGHRPSGRLSRMTAAAIFSFMRPGKLLVAITRDSMCTLYPPNLEADTIGHSIDSPGEFTAAAAGKGELFITRGLGAAMFKLRNLRSPHKTYDGVHANSVLAVDVHGDLVATAGADMSIGIWRHDGSAMVIDNAHSDWIRFLFFVSAPKTGNLLLLSCGDDGMVQLWDAHTCDHFGGERLTQCVRSATVCRMSKHLAVGCDDCRIVLIRVEDQGLGLQAPIVTLPAVSTALDFSSDGSIIVAAGEDEIVRLVRLGCNTVLAQCSAHFTRRLCVSFMTTISTVRVLLSPPDSDAYVVISAASDGNVVLWSYLPVEERSGTIKSNLGIGPLVATCEVSQ